MNFRKPSRPAINPWGNPGLFQEGVDAYTPPHPDGTDELFMVAGGKMQIALRGWMPDLKKGELVAIPKGMDHKPVFTEKCTVLLIEQKGICYTGGALTDIYYE